MNKRMFENIEVGDKVYSLRYGWCIVDDVFSNRFRLCDAEGNYLAFMKDGKEDEDDINPTLFWGVPEIEYKKYKPFTLENALKVLVPKKFEPKGPLGNESGTSNSYIYYNHIRNCIGTDYNFNFQTPNVIYFTTQSITEFFNFIEDNHIECTYDEFIRAYNNVFGKGE